MSAIAVPAPSAAPKAAWICLAIAWACFVLPIPGIGLLVGWPLNLAAFILAIVAMANRGAMAGLFQLLASLIVSPVIYFIGLALLIGGADAVQRGVERADANLETARAQTLAESAPSMATVSARDLFDSYKANEVAADQVYRGKRLQVYGTVERIDSGLGDEPIVLLTAGDFDSVNVQGLPAAAAASLAKGQQITVVCTGAGEDIGSPMLDDCSVQ